MRRRVMLVHEIAGDDGNYTRMPNSDWAGRPVLSSIVNRSSFLIGELLLGKLGETVVVAYLGPAVLTPLPSGRQNRHNRGVALRKLRFLEESLMPPTCVCVALVAIFTLTAYRSAQAQVTVDVTKVNCDQFVHHKISEPRAHRRVAQRWA